jgi:hypothetical protein
MSDETDQARNDDNYQTNPKPPEFDFASYPQNTLFHDRRTGPERRTKGVSDPERNESSSSAAPIERRVKKDRRRRIDPTTFEKQYTDQEMEFMNAMQRFKDHSGKSFPSHGDVLKVAAALGYRRVVFESDECCDMAAPQDPSMIEPSTVDA